MLLFSDKAVKRLINASDESQLDHFLCDGHSVGAANRAVFCPQVLVVAKANAAQTELVQNRVDVRFLVKRLVATADFLQSRRLLRVVDDHDMKFNFFSAGKKVGTAHLNAPQQRHPAAAP